tara:strand:+ start:522 stop:656 length:135 start_codon:yes stop_codon:yes gene_type:complete
MNDERWVIVRMVVLCNASVITEHGKRRSGLSNAPLYMIYMTTAV